MFNFEACTLIQMKLKKLFNILLFLIAAQFTFAQQTVVEWNFPNNPDNNTVDVYTVIPNNFGKTITTVGGTGAINFGTTGAITNSASATTWTGGSGVKYWEVSFSTTGCFNLDVSSKQMSSGTGPRDFKIQYKIGAGAYIDVPSAPAIINDSVNFNKGVLNFVPLPTSCENQPLIYLRWIMTSNTSVRAGANVVAGAGTSRIDEIVVNANSTGYFRTIKSGKWKDKTVWQYSNDNITWSAADTVPSYGSKTITIQSSDTVVIDTSKYLTNNCNFKIDEVYVNSGGELHINGGYVFINDGPGVDLNITGALLDSLSNVSTPNALNYINWNATATWSLGSYGSFIKTRNSFNTYWLSQYFGGVASIPSTANWVMRKVGPAIPNLPTTNMTFPNLIFENKTGTTYYAVNSNYLGCNFNGTASYVINGNLVINSNGLNAIVMYDSVFTNALVIKGDLIINSSGNLYLNGDSINLEGNLTVNGNLIGNVNTSGYQKFIFGGSNTQTINTAGGNILFSNAEINKSANDVIVNKSFSVDNDLEFTSGKFFTTSSNQITFGDVANALSFNNNSFVSGPCTKTGISAFTFPIGKGSDVQPLGINAAASTPFWTENFNNACTSGCIADGFASINGTWFMTDLTPSNPCGAGEENEWFVSSAENGNVVGACASNFGGNATLHIGSIATSPNNSSLCPTGDCGAAYDHGGWCDLIGAGPSTITDKQIESPIINCSLQKNITLAMKYIYGGDFSQGDSASLWYNDGVNGWTWLSNFTTTLACSQGMWTLKTIVLPSVADYNGNFQLAFRWTNNDDAMGNDPSFAVDSITLMGSEAFSSEYFPVNPIPLFGNNLQGTLDHISTCEYWDLSQLRGNSTRQVTLNWDANSCGVNSLVDLRVARFDATLNQWRNHGNGGTTGTTAAGTITTNLVSTKYCPYTLASATLLNPLPVSLLNFEVRALNNSVEIKWQTVSEPDNKFFTIQKSKTLTDIVSVADVSAKGNALKGASYKNYDNNPFVGTSYYRLKQTDINGNFTFTDWKSVNFNSTGSQQLYVTADVNAVNFSVTQCCPKEKVSVKIIDVYGQVVFEKEMKLEYINQLKVNSISAGVYFLTINNGETVITQKFVY